jgi:hypothetical protein
MMAVFTPCKIARGRALPHFGRHSPPPHEAHIRSKARPPSRFTLHALSKDGDF